MDNSTSHFDPHEREQLAAMFNRLVPRIQTLPLAHGQIDRSCNIVAGYHILQCGHHIIADHRSLICGTNCKLPGSLSSPFICQVCLINVIKVENGDLDAETEKILCDRALVALEKYFLTAQGLNFRRSAPAESGPRALGKPVLYQCALRPEHRLFNDQRLISKEQQRRMTPLLEDEDSSAVRENGRQLPSTAGSQTFNLPLRPRNNFSTVGPGTFNLPLRPRDSTAQKSGARTDILAPHTDKSKVQKRVHQRPSEIPRTYVVDPDDEYTQRVKAWWANHGLVPWPPGPRKQEDSIIGGGYVALRGANEDDREDEGQLAAGPQNFGL